MASKSRSAIGMNTALKQYPVFARDVDATMNYEPLLENTAYTWLNVKGYAVSVSIIGKLEVDFIARRADEGYAYIQVSMSVADPVVEEREYRPFGNVRDN